MFYLTLIYITGCLQKPTMRRLYLCHPQVSKVQGHMLYIVVLGLDTHCCLFDPSACGGLSPRPQDTGGVISGFPQFVFLWFPQIPILSTSSNREDEQLGELHSDCTEFEPWPESL